MLIPQVILEKIPPLYATEEQKNPLVVVKLFTPDSNWSWYITEYDPVKKLCFGLVDGHEMELGYFSLTELEALRGPMGLKIERDMNFGPTPLDEVKKMIA
jgi:hypothetical protein